MATAKIECICLVATKCKEMATFYSKVFGIAFESEVADGHTIYSGDFSGLGFVLVPVELSDVSVKESKVHFDIFVDDIQSTIALVQANGGRTNNRLMEDEEIKCIGVFDPDGNFMPVKQRKTA